MGKRARRIPSWPGVIHSNKGRIHLRRPTCDIRAFRLRRSGGPYIPVMPVIQTRSVRPAWSLPRLCGFITADTAGRLLLLLVKHLLYVESDVSVATNIVVTHLRMPIGIRNAT